LTSALDGGERSASHTGRFTPREITPGTPWIRGSQKKYEAIKDYLIVPFDGSNGGLEDIHDEYYPGRWISAA
jgi:hypothetical protein